MKLLIAFFLTICIDCICAASCKKETITEESNTSVIPSFVTNLSKNDDSWYADTLCVADGKVYYFAYQDPGKMKALYNEDALLVIDPTLKVNKLNSGNDSKFYVCVAGKNLIVDFSDNDSKQSLKDITKMLPSFNRFKHDTIPNFADNVIYSMEVDFPKPSTPHANLIGMWLANYILNSQFDDEDESSFNELYTGFTSHPKKTRQYKGNVHDYTNIARGVSKAYFANVKGEFGTDRNEYPSILFSILDLRAQTFNQRYVTYQAYEEDYYGGAHSLYTENLISFDHVHNHEVDFNYLFKPGSEKKLLDLLINEVKTNPLYLEKNPDIEGYIIDADKDGHPTGNYHFPQPGLTEEGVVFSFQPYAIDCFAAGVYHFVLPYKRLKHILTPTGRWCVGM